MGSAEKEGCRGDELFASVRERTVEIAKVD